MSEPYPHRLPWSALERAAEPVKPVTGAASPIPSLLVSVDWDFFLAPAQLAEIADERAELMAAGLRMGLEEWFSAERCRSIWAELAGRLEIAGADPDAINAPDPSAVASFAAALRERFQFGNVLVADSHGWGSLAALCSYRRAGRPLELISFDAHHDLGYLNYAGDSLERSQRRALLRPSCDDWVQAGLVHGPLGTATIVYPDWRGFDEWDQQIPTLPAELELCATPRLWSEWLDAGAQLAPRRADLLIVRSSAYSPPWGDADRLFLELVGQLAPEGFRCLDCDPPAGLSLGNHNACQPRPSR